MYTELITSLHNIIEEYERKIIQSNKDMKSHLNPIHKKHSFGLFFQTKDQIPAPFKSRKQILCTYYFKVKIICKWKKLFANGQIDQAAAKL